MKHNLKMIGVAFDCEDGHKRVTKADNFTLVGGSQESHERLVETATKVEEKLKKKGKNLRTANFNEVSDAMSSVGMKICS
jgi:hypothetical protein